MTPLLPQLAPSMNQPESKSQMSMGGPPLRPTFFNLVPALNPIHSPSGEKKGYSAPSVPGRAVAFSSERGRLYSSVGNGHERHAGICDPFSDFASPANTIVLPSGEIAKAVRLGLL